jgi:CDP-diacylglycerol--glycerol-3-phosphate 3-phosphatidyltransferase
MIWTIPNILTVARIAAAPCVALAFVGLDRPQADWVALGLFTGAALTDFLDGWLARRLRQTSQVGAMLDPIADKAMVAIALAVLLGLFGLEWWLVIPVSVILLREVMVSGLREYLGDVKLPVTPLAKWKTSVQMVAIALLLLMAQIGWQVEAHPGPPPTPRDLMTTIYENPLVAGPAVIALWSAAGLTAVTGWDYVTRGIAYIRARESEEV